jgi:hypothetical protein
MPKTPKFLGHAPESNTITPAGHSRPWLAPELAVHLFSGFITLWQHFARFRDVPRDLGKPFWEPDWATAQFRKGKVCSRSFKKKIRTGS